MDFTSLLPPVIRRALLAGISCAVLASCDESARAPVGGDVASSSDDQEARSNAADMSADGDRQLLWGDTHLHTINSSDGFGNGGENADIETAYRYARGLPVIHPRTGHRIQIDRPLDFLVVADHAEMLSVIRRLSESEEKVMATPAGKRLRDVYKNQGPRAVFREFINVSLGRANEDILRDLDTPEIRKSGWADQVAAAERHNRPGEFTALIGWEWTSTPGGLNLHRVVFTNTDGETAKKFLPFNSYASTQPEDLWDFFEKTHERTGADFISIPHNSNLSNGLMFSTKDSNGNPFTADYARRRSKWEPVVEVTQIKGTSETYMSLAPRDEFANFEIRERLLIDAPVKHDPGSYVRPALKQGLAEEARTGVNPFRFGLIGSTDSHTGFSSTAENDFLGKFGNDFLPAERAVDDISTFPAWSVSASGLAGVWSDGNTRQEIFDAFRRREVFATTGPRIKLRFFAGYDFSEGEENAQDFASIGYHKGVPMGGILAPGSEGKAPKFIIRAVKDPDGANLDRIQIIKGWLDQSGEQHEKIFDVAWSGDRLPDADGRLPPVGDTVDVQMARYENTFGDAELTTLWTDPEFDPAEPSFYYARVLEIPTPRHQVYDAVALRIDPETLDYPTTIQERAYSSPVWYRP